MSDLLQLLLRLLQLLSLITFFLRIFMRRDLDIWNHREKLDQKSTNTKQNSKKNFGRFWPNLAKCPKISENFNLNRFCRRWSQKMRNKKRIRHAKFEKYSSNRLGDIGEKPVGTSIGT